MKLSRREFSSALGLAAAGLLAGPALAGAAASAHREKEIDLSFVNPELRPAARAYLARNDVDKLTLKLVYEAQAADAARKITFKTNVPVVKQWVPVPGKSPDVAVYLINARPGARRPGIVHTHGGGFILGTARESVPDKQDLAARLDCFVATVEYRLAPETRYTGSMEDNYAALRWVYHHADELGVDPARIAVMGESAGGGHAALLALTARDRGEVPVSFQALIYPMLDDHTGSSRQPTGDIGKIIWTPQFNRFSWRAFLGQQPGTPTVPVAAVPARHTSLAGLPPAFIGVGSIDLFVDEDLTYARRLIDTGIATEVLEVPGAYHGFDIIAPETDLARHFTAVKIRALERAFSGRF